MSMDRIGDRFGGCFESHRNAGFGWLPLEKGIRAEPIVTRLKEHGILASGAEPFATTVAVPQALRLAFGGVPKHELKGVFQKVREAVDEASGVAGKFR